MSTRFRTRLGAVLAAAAVAAAGLLVGPTTAQAAPGDQVSAIFQPGDFGPQKTGTTVRKVFTLTNDGTDPISVDPSPVTTIAAPFAPVTTTITGTSISPGGTRTVTVDYTAGAVGSTPTQNLVFTATSDIDPMMTATFTLALQGQSIATDPASFEITQPTGGAVDFGQATVGSTVFRTIVITNNGIRDLKFESARMSIVGADGNPVPVVFPGAPFTVEVVPGASASFSIAYSPSTAGPLSGVITLVGVQVSGDVVVATATRTLAMIGGAALAPTPTPTPTPTPAVVSPVSGGSTPAAGTAARGQLASTGADGVGVFVGATGALMIVLAGAAMLLGRRRRAGA